MTETAALIERVRAVAAKGAIDDIVELARTKRAAMAFHGVLADDPVSATNSTAPRCSAACRSDPYRALGAALLGETPPASELF